MRSYRANSPEAAARIVAWTMLADGHAGADETAACDAVSEALGIEPDAWNRVVRELCEDLLATSACQWNDVLHADAHTLAMLLAEVDDAALRARVLALCEAVAAADGRISDRERAVLDRTTARWSATPELRPAA